MTDAVDRLNTALEGRYAIDRELGEGGMETLFGLGTGLIFGPGVDMYDVAPDDQQFLMIRLALGQGQSGVVVGDRRRILVQNFFEQLKEQVGN